MTHISNETHSTTLGLNTELNSLGEGGVVWEPSLEDIQKSNIEKFRVFTGESSLESLTAHAKEDPEWFWRHVCADLGIEFFTPPERFYEPTDDASRPRWCTGAEMNISTSCLDKWIKLGFGQKIAVTYEAENGLREEITYQELLARVSRVTAGLRRLGVQPGDVVAVMMPMEPNTVVAMLALARCGAIALPLFSGFGRQAIASRLQESRATLALVKRATLRRTKRVPMADVFLEAARLPEAAALRCVVIDDSGVPAESPDSAPSEGFVCRSWDEVFAAPKYSYDSAGAVHFVHGDDAKLSRPEVVSAESALLLIFTSGTTGRPKGALHTHCGFPIKAAQDMRHPMDLSRQDTVCWVTDIGWMMGPWLIYGTLLGGMTLALFDGAPDHPDSGRLWRFVHDHRVTFLGLSPALARMMRTATDGVQASDLGRLTESLRAVGSTGSPWDQESWMWIFENILGSRRPILNYSGGTEVSGGILCGNFISPLKPCSFAGPVLGMDADVLDPAGQSLKGAPGELVIRNHWIGMTRGFWNQDPRYFATYWERYPGLWTHGDYAAIDASGLWHITGRSDDTIKVAGKRLGPAEVESIVTQHPSIRESAAIGVHDPVKGESLVIFCVPTDFRALAQDGAQREALKAEIRQSVIAELGKPLAPKEVWVVESLPRTRNAKVMHRVIRALCEGQSPGDLSSLEDPAATEHIRQRL